MTTWVEEALQKAFTTIPLDDLMLGAAAHLQQPPGSWDSHIIRPSLLNDPCPLSQVKKYLGHAPQPGVERFSATRAGRPSATTAVNFARGYFMEGLLVAALKSYIQPQKDNMVVLQDDPWSAYQVIGCSPSLVFDAEISLANDPQVIHWQAHPDVVANYCGELELIQMKCPSVFKMDRI